MPAARTSREGLQRLYCRYRFASGFSKDKDLLEVACGAGVGLGYLARSAKRVVGGDIDEENLNYAQRNYRGSKNIELMRLDAEEPLPFKDGSFDVVIFYEAIYYLVDPMRFVDEAHRLLRDGGLLLISTVNKEWSDFSPSLFSTGYLSTSQLFSMLKNRFSHTELFGSFFAHDGPFRGKIVSILKRLAIIMGLIPKTMKGKEFLKRIFFGRLVAIPNEIRDGMADYVAPKPIACDSVCIDYKIIYALCRR